MVGGFLGDGRKVQLGEPALLDQVARQIILMQPLLDGDDLAGRLVVQTAD